MKQPEYEFLEGSLDTFIEIASHKMEIDPTAITERIEGIANEQGVSPDYIAWTTLYRAGLTESGE